MIIVSQKKMKIINFENVNLIGANMDGEIMVRLGVDDCTLLGKYKTVKRAEEVLQEIVKTYVLTEQYKVEDERTRIKLMMEGVLLYEMPKE